jgi:MoaA/NifB/PqqE/SkfB family radical SAM enzyme
MQVVDTVEHAVLGERLRFYLDRYFNLDRRIEAFRQRRLYSLEVELTNKCNRECCYCYNCSSRCSAVADMPFEPVVKLLKEAAEYGIKSMWWLGGEPTLYPKLEEVLKCSRDLGMENVLFTNGSLLGEGLWKRIRRTVDRIMFHLDTVDEESFIQINNISPVAGRRMLAATMRNLDGVLASGFDPDRISLYVVLFRPTFRTLPQTLEWALSEKGFGTVALYPMVRAGRAARMFSACDLTKGEIKRAFELRAECEERPELLLLGPSEYCKHYQMTMAYVRVDGDITPYAGLSTDCINAHVHQLTKVLDHHFPYLSFSSLVTADGSLNVELGNPCGGCPNSTLCFGTRTSAFNTSGSISAGDPFCWHDSQNRQCSFLDTEARSNARLV